MTTDFKVFYDACENIIDDPDDLEMFGGMDALDEFVEQAAELAVEHNAPYQAFLKAYETRLNKLASLGAVVIPHDASTNVWNSQKIGEFHGDELLENNNVSELAKEAEKNQLDVRQDVEAIWVEQPVFKVGENDKLNYEQFLKAIKVVEQLASKALGGR